jgi:hypothetical protein
MSPRIALVLGCLCSALFLRFDSPREKNGTSRASWIPTLWLLIVASRPVSLWLNARPSEQGLTPAELFSEGSPFDRNIFFVLIIAAVCVLAYRRVQWSEFVRENAWILLFAGFGCLSILWSDVALVAFKRWVKLAGHIAMAAVIATEVNPTEAFRRVLGRVTYILIPLSIVIIKYYPDYGRQFNPFTGEVSFTGVTNHKNTLGTLCMLAALFLVWSWTSKRSLGTSRQKMLAFATHLLCGAMVVWTIHKAHSSTDTVTALFGSVVLVFLNLRRGSRLRLLTPVVLCSVASLFVLYFSGVIDMFILAIGEDLTLTGRTDLWAALLAAGTNPLVGSGFESFWMGSVAADLWKIYWWHPIQAHDGFIETYLNLGMIGLTLISGYVLHVYARAVTRMRVDEFDLGRFAFTFLLIALFYNVTEAAFSGMGMVWVMLVFCGVTYRMRQPVSVPASLPSRSRVHHPQVLASNGTGLARTRSVNKAARR